jgi:hypothetical protein
MKQAFLLIFLLSLKAAAALVTPATLTQKMTENSGSGSYVIENELQFSGQFSNGIEPLVLREQWTIEDDTHMRLLVTGPGIRWNFLYENGQRVQQTAAGRSTKAVGEEFLERYFFPRKAERLQSTLVRMGLIPAASFQRRPFRMGQDPEGTDAHLRLARVGGVVTIAIGLVPETSDDLKPAVFVDQDQFVVRKIRFPSQAEVLAEAQSNFARGLVFPRLRTVRWGTQQVVIQTLHVVAKSDKKSAVSLEPSSSSGLEEPSFLAIRPTVEEFYKRFR